MQGSTWLERQRGVRFFAMALLVLGLILQTLSRMLSLPTGYGIEDFLGWVRPQSISAAVELWRAYNVRWVAVAYLSIDMLLFIPAYFIFFLGAGGRLLGLVRVDLHGDRHGDSSVAPGNQLERTPAASSPPSPHPSDWLVLLPITLLAMTDVAENAIGGLRIGFGDLLAVLLSGAAGVALFIKLKDVQPTAARYIQRLTLRALALIGLVAIALIFFSSRSDACTAPTGELISQLGCGAHSMKIWLTRIVVAVVLVLVGTLVLRVLSARRSRSDPSRPGTRAVCDWRHRHTQPLPSHRDLHICCADADQRSGPRRGLRDRGVGWPVDRERLVD